MVTCVDFANVWLNEGFATWAECLYYGHVYGRSSFNSYVANKAQTYFNQHHTRDFPVYDPPSADIYNTGIIYDKGAWVLRMLQFVEGDTAWQNPGVLFRALRAYGDSFKYGTASTADFQRINEHLSGQNLDWFFNEWVYDRGYPKYSISWNKQPLGDSWLVAATLTQRNDTNSARMFHMPYPIRFNCAGESISVAFHPQDTVALDTFVLAAEPLSLTPDPDNWVLDSCRVAAGVAEETMNDRRGTMNEATIARGVLLLPQLLTTTSSLLSLDGRKVLDLHAGPNDVSRLAPGIYFFHPSPSVGSPSIVKIVLAP
jgi:hypothetical protein